MTRFPLLTAALTLAALAPAAQAQQVLPAQSEISFVSKQMGVPVDKALAETLTGLHGNLAWGLAICVGLHVAGAMKHQWLDRVGRIDRMRPGRSRNA